MGKGARRRRGFAGVWRDVAREEDGRIIERALRPPALELRSERWVTRADTIGDPSGSGTPLTRFRTPFRALRPFRLRVSKRNAFDRVAEWIGLGGMRIGRAELDRRFTIRSSSPGLARSLLLGTRLGERLLAAEDVRIEIKTPGRRRRRELGSGVREADVRYQRVLAEAGELRDGFGLSWELVAELERVGVANPVDVATPVSGS